MELTLSFRLAIAIRHWNSPRHGDDRGLFVQGRLYCLHVPYKSELSFTYAYLLVLTFAA
jgi:hypothetical protein